MYSDVVMYHLLHLDHDFGTAPWRPGHGLDAIDRNDEVVLLGICRVGRTFCFSLMNAITSSQPLPVDMITGPPADAWYLYAKLGQAGITV